MKYKLLTIHLLNGSVSALEERILMDDIFGKMWRWRVSKNGTLHIDFDSEEDKCLFILKYGDYIV